MLRTLPHGFTPTWICRESPLFRLLSGIDREILRSIHTAALGGVLERSKRGLYDCLHERFASSAAKLWALKILNICLARRHFETRSTAVLSRPIGLVIDPSNMCQLGCPGCVHSENSALPARFEWPKGTLSEERLSALLRRYGPYAIGVNFYNYGEPLLNVRTPAFIQEAKRYGLTTALSTSLSVRRFDPLAYVESGLDSMVLSIDGATQRVYEQFRRGGDLELVVENIRRLVEARRALKRRTPILLWNFLVFEHNAHELRMAERLARRLGVDVFHAQVPFDISWDDSRIRPLKVRERFRRLHWAHLLADRSPLSAGVDAEAIDVEFERPWSEFAGDAEAGDKAPASGHACHWLYKNIVMDATGRILPCCGAPPPDGSLVFGQFDLQSDDPFNTRQYTRARSFFSAGNVGAGDAPHCVRCDWDHTKVNIGGREIRRYFRGADPAFFDQRSLRILADW